MKVALGSGEGGQVSDGGMRAGVREDSSGTLESSNGGCKDGR